MNASDVLYLLREPGARPRTLADLAADVTTIAIELTSAAAGDGVLALLTLDEAQAKLLHAARLLEEAHEAMHVHKLSELEQLCAHCGHDRGEHLVDEPHACEHEDDGEQIKRTCVDCGKAAESPVLPLCMTHDLARLARGETAHDIRARASEPSASDCKCSAYMAPGQFVVEDERTTDRVFDTERPPAPAPEPA